MPSRLSDCSLLRWVSRSALAARQKTVVAQGHTLPALTASIPLRRQTICVLMASRQRRLRFEQELHCEGRDSIALSNNPSYTRV
jgi:hypothetical protein